MRRAVGEGVEPSRSSYLIAKVSQTLRHRDKEVCLPNFTILQDIYFLFVDTNIKQVSISCKYFIKVFYFLLF